jgi:hypothetical protein
MMNRAGDCRSFSPAKIAPRQLKRSRNFVLDQRLAGGHAMRKADPPRAFVAINDDQDVPFNANRKLAWLCQINFTLIRLGQAEALLVGDKKTLDAGGVTVFMMGAHKNSAELERVRRYLSDPHFIHPCSPWHPWLNLPTENAEETNHGLPDHAGDE